MPHKGTLGARSVVTYQGEVYRVESVISSGVTLKSIDKPNSPPVFIHLVTLLRAEDFTLHGQEFGIAPLEPYESLLSELPQDLLIEMRKLQNDIREIMTGYQSGLADDPLPGEPRPAFNPATTTLTDRLVAKANELDLKERRMWVLYRQYREKGSMA